MTITLAVLLPTLLIGSIFSTLAGGGLGILMIIIGSFFLSTQQNIATMSVLLLSIQLTKLYHFHGHARWPIVGWYVLLGVPASVAGGYLLFILPPFFIEKMIGFLLLFLAIRDCIPRFRIRIRPTRTMLLTSGVFNGLLGGIIGNAAMMRGQILLLFGLAKEEFVGTSTAIALPMNLAKSGVYIAHINWTHEIILLFVFGIPLILIGVMIGKKILQHLKLHMFEHLQRGVIILGAIKFLLPYGR